MKKNPYDDDGFHLFVYRLTKVLIVVCLAVFVINILAIVARAFGLGGAA